MKFIALLRRSPRATVPLRLTNRIFAAVKRAARKIAPVADIADLFGQIADSYSLRGEVSPAEVTAVLVVGYIVIGFACAADVMMFFLLMRVKKGLVFTKESVSLIRGVSWAAVACGVLFASVGYMFYVVFAVAAAMLFLGLCVRVVKNVVEEATEFISENDLTV